MKTEEFSKLTLNKDVITRLNQEEQSVLAGGQQAPAEEEARKSHVVCGSVIFDCQTQSCKSIICIPL